MPREAPVTIATRPVRGRVVAACSLLLDPAMVGEIRGEFCSSSPFFLFLQEGIVLISLSAHKMGFQGKSMWTL
ncbi:hypothetical protein MRB53_002696 [Persea americana]|uniref:Uncharacterized protein n=1 Tax=Persea americana TaxID=3435 RepID=A0ACC2MVL1_PERAE|nr:hypothetical protein MRB53_002696 [Persea americana]